jgi:predicted adenylyl cyclase CyaB
VLASILGEVLSKLGVVKKKRRLYRVGQSRIHLDQVDRLGGFVEIEVVLRPGQAEEEGLAIARELCTQLGIAPGQFVPTAYIDLLREVPSPRALPGDDPA